MRPVKFVYDVRTVIAFSRQELNCLLACSERHYDGVCKAAGRHGGFLYGYQNAVEMSLETAKGYPYMFTMRQVDTMVKIMEQADSWQEAELYSKIRAHFAEMRDESRRINPGT